MPFNTALARNIDTMGAPTKKQKLDAGTPLKHFLRPLIEEATMRRMQMMQGLQPPQLPGSVGGMVESPSISPLQNALISVPQMGGNATRPAQGGSPRMQGRGMM